MNKVMEKEVDILLNSIKRGLDPFRSEFGDGFLITKQDLISIFENRIETYNYWINDLPEEWRNMDCWEYVTLIRQINKHEDILDILKTIAE